MEQKENKFLNLNLNLKTVSVETFIITGVFSNTEIINKLKNKIREQVKLSTLNYKTNVKGLFTGFHSLNEDEDFINFLISIKKSIQCISNYDFKVLDCWGNILRKGDEVVEHSHDNNGFSGILYLSENGPGTYFSDYDLTIEEKIGRYVLFTPFLQHSVKKIENNIERYSLAFNTFKTKKWEEINPKTL
jgi:hypothetical protein